MNKNKMLTLSLLLILLIAVIGVSYAFFAYGKTGLYTHTINGGKMNVIYDELAGNNITIDNAYPLTNEEALTKGMEFEFTVTGYNESEKNVYYSIEIDHGNDISGKNRLLDSDMKLTLFENDDLVFENEIFENLDNQAIHYGYFNYGTSSTSPVINNYKLRIWISDHVFITNTPSEYDTEGKSVYSTSDFANSYANFKVNVIADLTYDDYDYLTYDANGGILAPEKTHIFTNQITTEKSLKENQGFLGWSSDPLATEPEYKSGDYYNGVGQILYAVYSDDMNVMDTFPTEITSIKNEIYGVIFINETEEKTNEKISDASVVADLTFENHGKVTGYIIDEILYIASDGTTYLNTGYELFKGFYNIEFIDFMNGDSYYIENMESMFSFGNCAGIFVDNEFEEVEIKPLGQASDPIFINFEGFKTNNCKTMKKMFYSTNCIYGLTFENFNTENVLDMSYMFSTTYIYELDLSSFNTSKVTNMSHMFSSNYYLSLIVIDKFDTSQVMDMSWMFGGCVSNIDVDISNFDTSNVITMASMFQGSSSYGGTFSELDLRNFNTSKVADMSGMFRYQRIITKIDLSSFNTSNVTTMAYMFDMGYYGGSYLVELDLSNFDVSNVEDMTKMFYYNEELETIYANYDWNTGNITSDYEMFGKCTSLVGAISYNSSKIDIAYANPYNGYFTFKDF